MTKYVSILRGINVGGKRKVKMADLKKIYADLDFYEIKTYIQSGNVIFESNIKYKPHHISQLISSEILKRYKFVVPVITFLASDFLSIALNNPFLQENNVIENLHLTLLSKLPEIKNIERLNKIESIDSFILKERAIYLHIKGKYHQSKLTNNFFEKQLQVTATTRNWKTISKILEF